MTQQPTNTPEVEQSPLTTGELAKLCGVDRWQVLAAIRRGFLGEPSRIGVYRVWTAADVDRVVEALKAGGYLRGQRVTVPSRLVEHT